MGLPPENKENHRQPNGMDQGGANSGSARSEKGGRSKSPDVPGLEVLLQNVIAERNALRLQNDQLWKIIEKQRIIIAQLQAQVQGATGIAAGGDISVPLGSDGVYAAEGTTALTGIATQPSAPLHPPHPGGAVSPRKGSAHRDRAASERPNATSQDIEHQPARKRTVSEGRDTTAVGRRSTADRDSNNLALPAINPPRGNQRVGSGAPHPPGSAGARRERSASTSSQKATVLPPVPGAHPGGLQRKTSGSSITGASGPSVLSSGSNVAVYELNMDHSPSASHVSVQSGGSDPGSPALGEATRRNNRSDGSARRSRNLQQQQSYTDIGELANEGGDIGKLGVGKGKSADTRRKPMRPLSGRGGRLEDVSEGTDYPKEHPSSSKGQEGAQGAGGESAETADANGLSGDVINYVADRGDSLDRVKKGHSSQRTTAPPARVPHHPDSTSSLPVPTVNVIPGSMEDLSQPRSPTEDARDRLGVRTNQNPMGSNISISFSHGASAEDISRIRDPASQQPQIKSTDQINVIVPGSQIKLNDKGREVISFLISVREAATGAELYRVEKVYSDFLQLDAKLKANQTKTMTSKIGKLPEKALFTTHAPSKSDQRKVQLELYLQNVMTVCKDNRDLVQFLITDVVDGGRKSAAPGVAPNGGATDNIKEGYLFKKGKNFGAWKSRWFALKPIGTLEYYESQKDRDLLGSIKLKYVFVSRQSSQPGENGSQPNGSGGESQSSDTDYRHAFMLTEYKKSCFAPENRERADAFSENKVVSRHILCAENDEERDEWVRLIARAIREVRPEGAKGPAGPTAGMERRDSPVRGSEDLGAQGGPAHDAHPTIQAEDTKALPTLPSVPVSPVRADSSPTIEPESMDVDANTPVPPARTASHPVIMGATNNVMQQSPAVTASIAASNPSAQPSSPIKPRGRAFVDDNERVMMQPEPPPLVPIDSNPRLPTPTQSSAIAMKKEDKKNRRITTFNWGKKPKDSGTQSSSRNQGEPSRRMFGVPLEQAVNVCRIKDDLALPAVVYRCIEYLDAKKANEEEGIYRLSGSSSVIQGLKAAFDNEGDLDLLGSQAYYDVHAVAGLLKLYLRELPSPILTKELQRSFLHIMDLADRDERITELSRLVALLPVSNYTLLRVLIAHLVRVVRRCDINKMTVRNVGIVFSPTVGVPAGVFTLMMAEFAAVFWWDGREETRAGNGAAAPSAAVNGQNQEAPVPMETDQAQPASPSKQSGEDASADTDLPSPKRRQPNSAKRRARQNAGMGLANGLTLVGPSDSSSGSPGTDTTEPRSLVYESTLQQIPSSPLSPAATATDAPRPLSGSKRPRDALSNDSLEHAPQRITLDRESFGEVVIDGEESVHVNSDEEADGEESLDDSADQEHVAETGEGQEAEGGVREFDAYFSDGGEDWSKR